MNGGVCVCVCVCLWVGLLRDSLGGLTDEPETTEAGGQAGGTMPNLVVKMFEV